MHEIERDDGLFSVKETPWHGLGTVLDDPPTIEEGIRCAGLDWQVRLQETYTKVSDELVKLPNKAVVRSTDNKVLGVVGPTYTPVQNIDAFRFFQPAIDQGLVKLETAGSLRGGKKVWVLVRINGLSADVLTNDQVDAYFLLSNGHDGSMSVRVGFTGTRVVCANTLHMAFTGGRLMKLRHTAKVNEALEEVQTAVNFAAQSFEASIEEMRSMVRKGVDIKDVEKYVKRVFKPQVLKENDDMIFHGDQKSESDASRLVDNIIPLFQQDKTNNLPGMEGTVWAAYNAVTQYLSHERGRSQSTRVDSLWFGDSQKLLARAHKEALALVA